MASLRRLGVMGAVSRPLAPFPALSLDRAVLPRECHGGVENPIGFRPLCGRIPGMRSPSTLALILAVALSAVALSAQHRLGQPTEPSPGSLDDIIRRAQAYREDVPTPAAVLGYELGARLVGHADAHRVMEALAAASDRATWVAYGRSWQGRALGYLVVTRADRDLDEVQRGMRRLADPRGLAHEAQQELLDRLPAVAWLGYSVHGNELSCTEACLALAWHLCAADGDPIVDRILDRSVVVLDPIQNPDGRDRFVHHFENTVGRWLDREPGAAEHDEPWPGGRVNHYLFDMNRDWFAGTQPETRARWAAYQQWWPQLFIDVHTMGTNSTYYFGPPAVPHHPEITEGQHRWLERYGKHNSAWFDRLGFEYFTREQFDAFYPGYGEGWPTFHGAVGMTFEGASVRGLEVRREDGTVLRLLDPIGHHFVSTLGSLETLAENAREALAEFVTYRRTAIDRRREAVAYALLPGSEGVGNRRARALGDLLRAQGVEVLEAKEELRGAAVRAHGGGASAPGTLPEGTLLVPTGQPAGRLVEALLARHVQMDPEFVAEQQRRHEQRKGTQFYDLTGWSLPLLWGVECVELVQPWEGEAARLESPEPGPPVLDVATVAYVIPWGAPDAPRLLAALQRRGVRVHAADKYFVHGGRRFEAGTLIVKIAGNGRLPRQLRQDVVEAATGLDVDIVAVDRSWVDEGIAFGSNDVVFLEPPRVAVLWDDPVSAYGAGHCRWTLEQALDVPATVVRVDALGRLDLDRFNVLAVPSGRYGGELARHADRLRAWIRAGGTLVAIGDATRALAADDLGLLASETEDRAVEEAEEGEDASADEAEGAEPDSGDAVREQDGGGFGGLDYQAAIRPEDEAPARTTGALLRIDLDPEHWLAFGMGETCTAVSTSRAIFTPVKLDRGTNVGIYGERDALLRSGFAFDDKLDQLARKAWLIHQPLGRGHVVAFTEDPNFRGFAVGLRTLFANAVFFGPGH